MASRIVNNPASAEMHQAKSHRRRHRRHRAVEQASKPVIDASGEQLAASQRPHSGKVLFFRTAALLCQYCRSSETELNATDLLDFTEELAMQFNERSPLPKDKELTCYSKNSPHSYKLIQARFLLKLCGYLVANPEYVPNAYQLINASISHCTALKEILETHPASRAPHKKAQEQWLESLSKYERAFLYLKERWVKEQIMPSYEAEAIPVEEVEEAEKAEEGKAEEPPPSNQSTPHFFPQPVVSDNLIKIAKENINKIPRILHTDAALIQLAAHIPTLVRDHNLTGIELYHYIVQLALFYYEERESPPSIVDGQELSLLDQSFIKILGKACRAVLEKNRDLPCNEEFVTRVKEFLAQLEKLRGIPLSNPLLVDINVGIQSY